MYSVLGFFAIAALIGINCKKAGRCWLLSPLGVFLVGTGTRWGIGGLLVGALGSIHLPDFDWGQYKVTYDYMPESTKTWAVFLTAIVSSFIVLRWFDRSKRDRKICLIKEVKNAGGGRVLNRTVCWLGIYTAIATIVPFVIGSNDRGAGYEYWAGQVIRPDAALLVLARLKYVFYFLLGFAFGSKSISKVNSAVLIGGVAILAVIGGWQGSRGDFMYPVLIVVIGWLLAAGSVKATLKSVVVLSLLVVVSVPLIAAFRDTSQFNETSQHNLIGRMSGILSLSERPELVKRRYLTLGREVYACSDGYVYKATKGLTGYVGFSDLTPKRVVAQLTPAVLGGSKEKFDSAETVQALIGIERIRSWYPCLYMPADLYRRGGIGGVVTGGLIYGIFLGTMTLVWERYVVINYSSYTGLLIWALPVSMLQAPPAGTVLEVLWFTVWEAPKYVIAALIVGWGMDKFYRSRGLQ